MLTHAMRAMLPPNAEGRSEAVALASSDDGWRLLAKANLGRIAVQTTDGLDIFPINYVVTGEEVFFRSAPGSKLVDIAANPVVAFEVDGRHGGHRWSVVVKGTAHRLDRDDMIESSVFCDCPPRPAPRSSTTCASSRRRSAVAASAS